jgi:hypothetical protein
MMYSGHIRNGVAVLDQDVKLPEGTPVLIQPAEFWQGLSINELATRQQVMRPCSTADLAGDWPDQDSLDEFLQSVKEARR